MLNVRNLSSKIIVYSIQKLFADIRPLSTIKVFFFATSIIFSVSCGVLTAKAQSPTIQVVLVRSEKIRTISNFVGRVEAFQKVDIKSNVTGTLQKLNFVEGAMVKKGQVLFEIDPELYELDVRQSEADLKVSQANLANEEVQLGRSKFLAENKAISQSQYDKQKMQKMQAEASVDQSKLKLYASQIKFEQAKIKSPISGRIGRALLTPGNQISQDTGVLAKVVDDSKVKVYFSVTQKELLEGLKRKDDNQTIAIAIELPDGTIYKEAGVLDFLDVTTDQKTDSLMLRAEVRNTENLLFDGEIVHIIASRDSKEMFLLIPHKAVLVDQLGSYCFVVGSDGNVTRKRIKTGQETLTNISVISGLIAGEMVALSTERLQEGMKVNYEIIP